MITHNAFDVSGPDYFSLFEGDDIVEPQEAARVQESTFIPYSFLPNCGMNQRYFSLESADQHSSISAIRRRIGAVPHLVAEETQSHQPPQSAHQGTELKTYFDDEFATYYFVPLSPPLSFGEVNRFVERFQVEGGYCGLSCGRKLKLKNLTKESSAEERCDIIALTKNPLQVKHEAHFVTCWDAFRGKYFNSKINQSVKDWQSRQAEACEHITVELKAKIKEWNYGSFMIADESMLLTLGYSEEKAKQMHLLALFYKRVPIQQ